ncbi:geranylgeranylglycerol-phosphate geranylgeranyltransferase [Aquimarina sp. 2201CG5-10]|uniref:geranylgeranylglycerol-phosphate geranylgeranyltransferase n=1 Tax=Aquimarina callyspongiae TaxID=3098150 RepID=UPI002AB58EE0|nr:geranylgeranylglycerol-phosphate geranylgeranyltransferase [Aquimarina sp. 2201CG5-10]MDY8136393.1 geranylgeranylglycerol-phosphate geranylgeranyltransferase [Aquimarina sp. 2201CG5-10]
MLPYLKLVKFDNLLIIALAQLCIKYGLFEPFDVAITLNNFGIGLVILATFFITAAGNIIIEVYNAESSNHKELLYGTITEKSANRLFIIFNVIGVFIGFYLSNLIGKPGFVALFIIISGLFYVYASYLKEITGLKNILIGSFAALSLLVIGIFDLLPAITEKNRESQTVIFSIIFDYSIFAFLLVTLREIIKDCTTVDRDYNVGIKTIPVVLGKDRTSKLVSLLTLIPIIAVIYYIYTYLFSNSNAVILVLFLIVAPLLYFMIKSYTAESLKHFKQLSLILKIILILGAISLLLYQFILK